MNYKKKEQRGSADPSIPRGNRKRSDDDDESTPSNNINAAGDSAMEESSSSGYNPPNGVDDDNDDIEVINPEDVAIVYDDNNRCLYSVVNTEICETMDVLNDDDDEIKSTPTIDCNDYVYHPSDDDGEKSIESIDTWTSRDSVTIFEEDLYLRDEITEQVKTIDGSYVTETVVPGTRFTAADIGLQQNGRTINGVDYLSIPATRRRISELVGSEVTVGKYTWKHVSMHSIDDEQKEDRERNSADKDRHEEDDYERPFYNTRQMDPDDDFVGLKNFDFKTQGTDSVELFRLFWPGNEHEHITKINDAIWEENERRRKSRQGFRKIKDINVEEYYIFLGIMILGSVIYSDGTMLWNYDAGSIIPRPMIGRYMSKTRFKELRKVFSYLMADKDREQEGSWWRVSSFIEEFNESRIKAIATSSWKCFDESIFAFRPRTTKTGGLPHLVYIIRKPEPFGIEVKVVCDPPTGCMVGMELQEGKELMKQKAYNHSLGATTGCAVRLMELTCNTCHVDGKQECYTGDSWFASAKTTVELVARGINFVGQVKQCCKNFPRKYLEQTMESFEPGHWVVMQTVVPMIPVEGLEHEPDTLVKVLAIGYKYCYSKVLCFVMNQNAGSVLPGPKYKAKYWTEDGSKIVKLYDRPNVISKYFSVIGTVDNHNMSRQGKLALEKAWKTHDPYHRFMTSMIGVTITDIWKIYRWHIEGGPHRSKIAKTRRHKDWGITVEQMAERIGSALLRYFKPEAFPIGFIYGQPTLHALRNQGQVQQQQQDEDSSVEVVPNPQMICHEVQSVSSTEVAKIPRRSLRRHTPMRFGAVNGRQERKRCRWCYLYENKIDRRTSWYCLQCDRAFCMASSRCVRDCFSLHIQHYHAWQNEEKKLLGKLA